MVDEASVGIVTVTYNSSDVIIPFVECLLTQTYKRLRLYAVDNASSDGTVSRLLQYQDGRISVIANRENVGVAEGNNEGIRAALADGCDYVLLINNDTEFGPSLLEQMMVALRDSDCDMIAPKILFFDNQQMIWSAGGGFSAPKGYLGFHYGLGEMDRGQFDAARIVENAPTCCLLVRRSVFERIGLMDGRYFVYLDDADFCFRAARAGLKLFYCPSVKLFHKVGSLTGGPSSEFNVRFCTRNHIFFILKNLGLCRALYYLPAYQIRLIFKLLSQRIDTAGFLLREAAFVEGLRIWRSSLRNGFASRPSGGPPNASAANSTPSL